MTPIEYEAVIGLEVHAELKTASKIFCACSTQFGAKPNTQCCPICMGHPGTLPTLNRGALELAIKAGLALECQIARQSRIDRKHYFYPDLPKAYQISQESDPLCKNGMLRFYLEGKEHCVGIERIHIEEDAGKLIHSNPKTLIDFNRCGVPLIEIVSKPELRSGAEAAAYLRMLKAILVRCEVSDCKMQEGSLRCDVNISLRHKGSERFGVRTEIKNLNSFAFAEKAINYEIKRQSELLKKGERVEPETRRYDAARGITVLMRKKETAEDYRYLPEANLPIIALEKEEIEAIAQTLPELPIEHTDRLVRLFGLRYEDAAILTSELALSCYFEAAARATSYPKTVANLLLTDLLPHCAADPFSSPIPCERLSQLAELLGNGMINSSIAKKLLLRLTKEDFSPAEIVEREQLGQIRDEGVLQALIADVIKRNPAAVQDFQNGKKNAIRALQGQMMAASGGRAEPRLAEALLLAALNETEQED